MKKILCLLISVFFLCSCGAKSNNITPVTKGISFNADISYYNETYTVSVNIADNGDTEISYNSPKELSGLKIIYSGDQITADYNGIKYNTLQESLPQYSASDIIYKAFSHDYDTVYSKDDSYYVEYDCDGLNFKMYLGATGLPIKIESPYLSAEIKNATIITK